uniref:Uncharacterized protein n=1 Tax=Lepeophtheirus salmonis TaxID=72036 RepID=A0A0K2U2D7_LEPSM
MTCGQTYVSKNDIDLSSKYHTNIFG